MIFWLYEISKNAVKILDSYIQDKKIQFKAIELEHKNALNSLSEKSSKEEIDKLKIIDAKYSKEDKEIKQLEDCINKSNQEQKEMIISILEYLKIIVRDLNELLPSNERTDYIENSSVRNVLRCYSLSPNIYHSLNV